MDTHPYRPNLSDYTALLRTFDWKYYQTELLGDPSRSTWNLAELALNPRGLAGELRRTAIRWIGKDGKRKIFSYEELAASSHRFAQALKTLGVSPGDAVFSLLGRVPELSICALGTLLGGGVFCPLFSAFGPEPIRTRMELGKARVLVTTEALYRRKVSELRAGLPELKWVILVGESETPGDPARSIYLFEELLAAAPPARLIPETRADDRALLHFTSGTTGRPKGAVHVHRAALMHYMTGKLALDLHVEDVFWCTADPGWVTGTSYGIFSPLLNGVTSVVSEAEFDPEGWYRILQEEGVSVWYTAPTAIRMLMKAGTELPRKFDLRKLRFIGSVGEPLNPEAVVWGREVLGLPIHDNWWQTETGGIMIANFLSVPIKPGSMGKPLPGVTAAIVERTGPDSLKMIETPNVPGELALKPDWPSMFRGYLGEEERYKKCFAGGFYLTGDLASRDADGYYWFFGRADDVIKSSGHLIGPFEVESVLMEHPAVAESAVIGKPDPTAGETVKAFVSLKTGYAPEEALRLEILALARKKLGAAIAPKEIVFLPVLPRTRSGKLMRRLLKAREMGLPEGDLSTLETGSEGR